MDNPSLIPQRIRQARKERGLTIQQLADKLGCSHPNVHQWESGKRNPKLTTLHRIANALAINLNWLLTGEGEMGKSPRPLVTPLVEGGHPEQAPLIKGGLRGDQTRDLSPLPQALPVRWIPILGVVPGGPPFEPSVVPLGSLAVSVARVRHIRAFALRVMGYSMHPIIEDGDLIACEPYEGEHLAPGAIVVALVEGETTIKSFARRGTEYLLVAISGSIKPILLREGDRIIARVVSVHKPA